MFPLPRYLPITGCSAEQAKNTVVHHGAFGVPYVRFETSEPLMVCDTPKDGEA